MTRNGRLPPSFLLARGSPDAQRAMPRGEREVGIRRQQSQLVAYAQLAQQRVDGPDLNPRPPANVADIRSINIVLPIRHQERQGSKSPHDVLAGTRASKALQQFLQHEASSDKRVTAVDRGSKCQHLGAGNRSVPAKGERPNAGVDEQSNLRERSAL